MNRPYIQNSRYVSISSPPPQNRNLFRPSIYYQQPAYLASPTPHHAPLRPQPLQPPPQQIIPPPPTALPLQTQQLHHHHPPLPTQFVPPQKVSYNPQFTVSPNFSPNPNSKTHNQFLKKSSDFVLRIPIDDDRQRQREQHHHQRMLRDFDTRPDPWDPPRNVPANHPVVGNLDHRHQFDHRPMSPYRSVNKIKLELDASYRFRERYNNDAFELEYKSSSSSNQREKFVPHRSHFVSDSDRLNSSNYGNQHGSQFDSNELVRNNVRDGFFDRQVLRDRESLIERGSNGENIGDGLRGFSGKREFYGSDSGRYGNTRGSRENSYEYNRTPGKQVPKKSALLRIHKPSYRNRDGGELHYSGYEMKSGSFRGKEQVLFSYREVGEEEERERSPVELDVSFKSNSLVAKAIVTSSSSAIVSDTNLTAKKGNARKVMVSDKNCSSSQMNKLSDSGITLDSCRVVASNSTASNNKDLKPSEKEVETSSVNIGDNKSQPCSSRSTYSLANMAVGMSKGIVSNQLGNGVGTDKISSLKVAKKKKVVKKVVKKAVNPVVPVSGSQPTKKLGEPLKAEGFLCDAPAAPVLKMGVKPSKERIISAMPTGHLVDLQPCPNEANILARNDNVGGSPQAAMVSKDVSIGGDSHVSSVFKIKRKRSGLISSLSSSSHKETKIDKGDVNTDNCLHVVHTALKSDKNLTKSLNENTVSDIYTVEGASHQFCHNGHSTLLESSATKASSESLFSAGRNIYSDLLRLEEKERLDGLVNTSSITHGMNPTTSFNNGLVVSLEKITNSAEPCKGQMSPSAKSSTMEGFPSGEISAFSDPEETRISNVFIYAGCSNHDKCSVSASDDVNVNSEGTNLGTGDYKGKQLAQNEFTVSLDNVATEGIPNTKFSVGMSEEDIPSNTNKSKVMTSLSNLLEAMTTDISMGPAKAVGSSQCDDSTTNLSVKDFSPAEARVTGSLDVGTQSGSDGYGLGDVLSGRKLTGRCFEAEVSDSSGLSGTSPDKRKRRKIYEGLVTSDLSTFGVELPSNSNVSQLQTEEGAAVSNVNTLCNSNLPPSSDGITVLLENSLTRVSSEDAVSVSRDAFRVGDYGLKIEHPRVASCSASGDLEISNAPFCRSPGSESKQIINENPVIDGSKYNEVVSREGCTTDKMKAVVAEEQVKVCSEATQFETPPEHVSPDLYQILPATDVESHGCLLEKGDLPSVSIYPAFAADGDGVSTTKSNEEMMEFDSPSNMCSPEILSDVGAMHLLNREACSQISNDNVCEIDKIPTEKPVLEVNSNLSAHTSPSEYAKINLKSDYRPESGRLAAGRTVLLPLPDVKGTGHSLNPASGKSYGKKNHRSHTVSRIHPSHSSSTLSSSRNTASSTCITKPRTWHRMESSSAYPVPGNKSSLHIIPQRQLAKKVAKFQSVPYIRKGNSLVRKSAPVAALPQVSHGYLMNSSGVGESKKTTGSDSIADAIESPNFFRMGGLNAPFERPGTPPLPAVSKVPNCTTNLTGDCPSSPLAEPHPNVCSDTTLDPQKFMKINEEPRSSNASLKISETPVKRTGLFNSLESQGELNDGTLVTSNAKRITYVKRKLNQLIAASNVCGRSVQNPDKTQALSSDGYYKRSKNQLIRTSLDSSINQTGTLVDGILTLESEKAPNDIFSRSFSNSQSYKVEKKICKPLKFSRVWNSLQSSKDDDHSSYRQKFLPYLSPWKRAAYWKRFVQHSNSISNNTSLSAIGRKLLLLRKRDAVYRRSKHGFSLRKAKVLSVGGSNLKWSKSIENRSKKANEKATMAVAAAEKKKKQQNGAESFASETKSRSYSSKNRIFRFGSVRYKMDSSRRTLLRISDDGSSCSAAPISKKNAKKSYIPRRLVIGNDEYVQIGNGNQLIRDPKKRARVLASEKVRWSLHTARLRLARKRTYCQFFTRFGKCNKDNGKCPYIHDPSKIAVCTKFLNGLCSNSDCILTHKVIPERMPDCSYFLQGLCTNKSCPYRHVHVNPSSSTCEGFLKGYCADGNECRKKHSHVCPTFEATGSCPLGSKCKLHHPKSRSKGKKSRRSGKQKSNRGRYFGSVLVEDSEPQITMTSERHSVLDNGNLFLEGKLADYIRLDFSNEEAGETNDALSEWTIFRDSDSLDLQFDDLDELIKPIRIMNPPLRTFFLG